MDLQAKLKFQLKSLEKLVPTMLVIGLTEDKHGVMLMGSPEETNDKRMIDLAAAVAMMMEQQPALRELLFSAVSWYMQENPKYQEAMQEALDKLKELNEHQRTAQPK